LRHFEKKLFPRNLLYVKLEAGLSGGGSKIYGYPLSSILDDVNFLGI
jgi:hypothetical protein